MAKVFLDTNAFIDLVEERRQITLNQLDGHDLFISPLSIHILMYITKRKIPYSRLNNIIDAFFLIAFDITISDHSLIDRT